MAIYFDSVDVKYFRGINNLSIENLNHINIIAGDNNSGKTSLLEALMLFRNPKDFTNVLRVSRLREIPAFFYTASPYENFINLFNKKEKQLEISLKGIGKRKKVELHIIGEQKTILFEPEEFNKRFGSINKKETEQLGTFDSNILETESFKGELHCVLDGKKSTNSIEFNQYGSTAGREVSKSNYINIVYLAPADHMRGNIFTRILQNDAYKEICVHILRLFDPEINDLLILKNEITGRPVEYVKHEVLGNMPLSTYGDGIKKVLSLADAIANATGGILLIDEVETAIHSKYYDDIFRFIVKACKQFDVQAFITTHSSEAIDGLIATQDYDSQEKSDDISVLTFKKENTGKKTYSRVLTGRHVKTNREQFGFEVRV